MLTLKFWKISFRLTKLSTTSTVLEMKRKNIFIILPLLFALAFGLVFSVPASAQWRTQNIVTSAEDSDVSVSPSKGPDDAPVEIAVFSCFQ